MLLDAQKRYLLNHFLRLDELFGDALDNPDHIDDGRLFKSRIGAMPAERTRVLADHVAELRNALRRFMCAQDIHEVLQPIDVTWAFRTAIIFAETTVRELRPEYLRGYGEVDPTSFSAINELITDLQRILQQMRDEIANDPG